MNKERYWGYFALIILSLNLPGCGSDNDLDLYIKSIRARPPKRIQPIPKMVYLETFNYPEIDNRRHPFMPVSTGNDSKNAPNLKRPKQPLEAFSLDALQFVGTFQQNGKIWALIKQPGGLITPITKGDYMGKNYGEVTNIQDKILEIEETMQVEGKWEKKKTNIDIYKPTEKPK